MKHPLTQNLGLSHQGAIELNNYIMIFLLTGQDLISSSHVCHILWDLPVRKGNASIQAVLMATSRTPTETTLVKAGLSYMMSKHTWPKETKSSHHQMR